LLLESRTVEGVTGSKVVSKQRVSSMDSPNAKPLCSYEVGEPFGSVTVYLNPAGKAEFRKRFNAEDESTEPIPDIGDLAYLRGGNSAHALIGPAYVGVSTQYYTGEASEVVKELLRRAITSL